MQVLVCCFECMSLDTELVRHYICVGDEKKLIQGSKEVGNACCEIREACAKKGFYIYIFGNI